MPNDDSSLHTAVRKWLRRNPSWATRWNDAQLEWRHSTVEEVAESLVQDPAVIQALGILASPAGQAIERTVLSQVMAPTQASLLTDALTMVWKRVRNQNLPIWKRADFLVGTVIVLIVIGALVYYVHHRDS